MAIAHPTAPGSEMPDVAIIGSVQKNDRASGPAVLAHGASNQIPFIMTLTEEASATLKAYLAGLPVRGYQADPSLTVELGKSGLPRISGSNVEKFEEASLSALRAADPELLRNIASTLRTCGVVVIRNIDYGETAPTNTARCMHDSPIPEAMIAGVTRALGGKLVAYSEELLYSHPLFHDIRPTPTGREGSNGSGKEEMIMHMDMSYHVDRNDLLFLACIEEGADKEVTTPFVRSKDLYDALTPEEIRLFRNPENWIMTVPQSLGGDAVLMPILEGTPEHPIFNMRPHLGAMSAVPGCFEAAQALARLRSLMGARENHCVHLQRGDLLIMDNLAVLHRRTSFTGCPCGWHKCRKACSGTHRQLMRAYGKFGEVPADRLYHTHGRTVRATRSRL